MLDRKERLGHCRSMALLDHIRRCNRWNPAHFVPFRIGTTPIGFIRPALTMVLRDFPSLFTITADSVSLIEQGFSAAERSAAFRPVAERLVADGLVPKLRGEDYRVVTRWGAEPLMVMDRAIVSTFGIRAFGIHVNGMVRDETGIKLWIGKRAADKAIEPGKLDNIVAGGQPSDLSLRDNLIKEAGEEAGLAPSLAGQATPVGAITYRMEEAYSLRRDTLFVYDLILPSDVLPRAVDGEMQGFSLMAPSEILPLLRDGFSFKFNVALVLIDFMIRHGILNPDNDPDYLDLVAGLRRPLD